MSKTLERTTFSTSRLLEFFTAKELQMQIGHDQKWWPIALTKELIDNALDACETAGVAPEIKVVVEADAASVQDNGPGLPVETLKRSLDYAVRVSDKSFYVSPSRGQLGNALKCVWAAPFVIDGKHGRVDIVTGGKEYQIDVSLDRIAQQPRLELSVSPNGVVKSETLITVHWPEIAGYLDGTKTSHFYNPPMRGNVLVARYSAFNPHAAFSYVYPNKSFTTRALREDWRKWRPCDPTSPHWYDIEALRSLIAAYVADERKGGQARTVREFVSEFRGLSSTAKQKLVLDMAMLSGTYLHDLVNGNDIDSGKVALLLGWMQKETRPVKPNLLGIIGEQQFASWLVTFGGADQDSIQYAKKTGMVGDLSFVVEVAFGTNRDGFDDYGRELVIGLNWSPALSETVFSNSLHIMLSEAYVDNNDPVTLLVHVTYPRFEFMDRGKSAIALPGEIREALESCIKRTTKEWTAYKKRLKREARAQQREWEEAQRARRRRQFSIIEAAYEVMEAAYMKASANGKYPANARQIMYAARPGVLRLTGGKKWKKSSYFTQTILPRYMEDFPEETADWDVVWDARGKLVEPHTAHRVDLGGIAVRRYIHSWRKCKLENEPIILDRQTETRGPEDRYNFALFVEKEGFNPLLEAARLADKWDIAIMSTKGMSVTAARQLVDRLSQKGVTILMLRDFDKAGFSIIHTLSTDTPRYRFKAKPNVIDLGLRLEDVKAMGLESEEVRYTSNKDPRENLRESGATEEECNFLVQGGRAKSWYGERIELNAMTSAQLVEWLAGKLEAAGVQKVMPDSELLKKAYRRAKLIAEVQGAIDAVCEDFDADAVEIPDDLHERVQNMIKGTTDAWDDAIWKLAQRGH